MSRAAGIFMPVIDLRNGEDESCFSQEVRCAVSWRQNAGQNDWDEACVRSICTAAGSPQLLLLEPLIRDGVLTREECDSMDFGEEYDGDFEELCENRQILLTMAYERSDISRDPDFQRFVRENGWWLEECSLYLALQHFFGGRDWQEWPEDIRQRYGFALDYYRRELYFDIEFQMYLQFQFFRQYRQPESMARIG